MPVAPGQILADRYDVETILGQGGFATVYQVRHRVLGTSHALKALRFAPRGNNLLRLLAEGRMQARLDHPNIGRG